MTFFITISYVLVCGNKIQLLMLGVNRVVYDSWGCLKISKSVWQNLVLFSPYFSHYKIERNNMEAVLIDLSGTLHIEDSAVDGAVESLNT